MNETPITDLETVLAYCGNNWTEFSETIPAEHAALHVRGIALILTAYSDSLLPTQFIELSIDERMDSHMKSVALRKLIYDNLLDIINKMGVSLNIDIVEITHIPLLMDIIDFFYTITEIEDSYTTVYPQLIADDESPKYRFINAISKVIYDTEEPDISDLESIIDDVSEVSLKTLADAITNTDGEDIPPDNIITRVVQNKNKLDNSLGYTHVRNGGVVGSDINSYLNFFTKELTTLLEQDTLEGFEQYGYDIISLHLISDINDDKLKDTLLRFFDGRIDNIQSLIRIESYIKSLILSEVNHEPA